MPRTALRPGAGADGGRKCRRNPGALQAQWEADTNRQTEALAELQQALNLAEPPNRIECYDISNTQGTAAVGSMVVFEQGVPSKKLYRRFNIQTVEGPDDFASMEEVLTRRFNRWQAAQEARRPTRPAKARPGLCAAARPADRRRRQRPAGPGGGGAGAVRPDGQGAGGGAGQAAGRAVLARSSEFPCCCRAIRRGCTWSSASAMKPTALPSPPPQAAQQARPGLPPG